MRKRIGTKLYDTEGLDAICNSDLGLIYRKQSGIFFACDEKKQSLIPLEYETAKEIVRKNADTNTFNEYFTIRDKDTVKKPVMISMSEYDKAKLRRLSSQRKMSMSEYIVFLMEQDETRLLR